MKLTTALEQSRALTRTGRAVGIGRLLPLIPTEHHNKLKKLHDKYPLNLACHILDFGFPQCPICSGPIKSNREKVFTDTCSIKCWHAFKTRRRLETLSEKRKSDFDLLRKSLNKKDWKLLATHPTEAKVRLECKYCSEVRVFDTCYALLGHTCVCQVGKKIRAASLMSTEDFEKSINKGKKRFKLLGKYKGQNATVKVKCLQCSHVWKPYAGNLNSHGCVKCSQVQVQKDNIKKYGVRHVGQRPDVIKSRQKTMMRKYGVEHALQHKPFFDKAHSSYGRTRYKLNGTWIQVQGYEPLALDYLIHTVGISPEKIMCGVGSDIPKIPYKYRGKVHYYYPDIYILHLNRIVEVKSTYTYAEQLKKNKRKERACIEAGFKFSFLIMSSSGDRIDEPN